MSAENKKKNPIQGFLHSSAWKSFLLALVIEAGMLVLGGLCLPGREDRLYRILWFCDLGAIGLCCLATAIFLRRNQKIFNDRNVTGSFRAVEQRRQRVEADLARAAARVRGAIWFARLWYAVLVVLACGVLLLLVPADLKKLAFLQTPSSLLGVWMLWGLLSIWFGREKSAVPLLELSKAEYPVIHGLAEKAAAAAGCTLPVRIFAGGESVGITRMPKEVWLLLDAVPCALFTKSELYHALLHEFAHEDNEDTLQTLRLNRELELWSNLPDGMAAIGAYPLNLSSANLALEYYFYDMFVSIHKEEQADAAAVRWGSAQELVNGLAKLSVWSVFEHHTAVPEISLYAEYAGEEPPTDIPARAVRTYRSYLPRMREAWRHRLDVELPPRVSSHPIFRQRREAFGITDYTFEAAETDPAYLAEADALLALIGKAVSEQMAEDYGEVRKAQYLDRKELIDKAKAVTDWSAQSLDDRIEMAKALAVLEPDLQETVIQSILAQEPENSYGVMLLGAKRFRENDPACVDLLKKAAELNINFVEPAYDMLGEYALASGDEALLEEYRAKVVDAVQTSRDTDGELGVRWKGRERLSANDLPAERFAANRDAIAQRTEGKLAHLYSVRTDAAKGACYSYFLVFRDGLSPEEQDRLYDQVFLYLDYLPEEEYYSLANLTGEAKKIAYLLRHVPDCEIPLTTGQKEHNQGTVL